MTKYECDCPRRSLGPKSSSIRTCLKKFFPAVNLLSSPWPMMGSQSRAPRQPPLPSLSKETSAHSVNSTRPSFLFFRGNVFDIYQPNAHQTRMVTQNEVSFLLLSIIMFLEDLQLTFFSYGFFDCYLLISSVGDPKLSSMVRPLQTFSTSSIRFITSSRILPPSPTLRLSLSLLL